jgi:MFS family permease
MDSALMSLISTFAEFASVLISYGFVARISRRSTLVVLFAVGSISMLSLAAPLSATASMICLFVARTMSSSAFAVTELYTSEVYPTTVRSTAIGIASAIARSAGIATSFLAEDLPTNVPIIIFGVASGLACFISLFLKVETSGRDLVGDVEEETEIGRSETSVSVAEKFMRRESFAISEESAETP